MRAPRSDPGEVVGLGLLGGPGTKDCGSVLGQAQETGLGESFSAWTHYNVTFYFPPSPQTSLYRTHSLYLSAKAWQRGEGRAGDVDMQGASPGLGGK